MDGLVFPMLAAQGMPRTPPGLERPYDSAWDVPTPRAPLGGRQPSSGARTPDFLAARGASVAGYHDAHHTDGAETPRDGTEGARLIMDQVCSKLRSLEMKTQGALAQQPMDDARMVPLTYGLLSINAAPPAPVLSTYRAAGACRPPPGLPMPIVHSSPVPPPPEPSVLRAKAGAQPKFVVSYGSVGHPLQCGAMCQRDACELGARCPDCHICRSEQVAEQARRADAPAAMDQCPSVGSIGHPYTCAEACKFHPKDRGCKDGALCTRCHVCRWSRYPKRRTFEPSQAFGDFAGN